MSRQRWKASTMKSYLIPIKMIAELVYCTKMLKNTELFLILLLPVRTSWGSGSEGLYRQRVGVLKSADGAKALFSV